MTASEARGATTTGEPAPGEPAPAGAELVVRGVTKEFDGTAVLHGIDLTVPAGSTTAVVGPSGSGKTTLLRLIAGFERPGAGSIRLGDRDLVSGAAWVPAHRREVGYVAQDGALFPHLSVGRNIAFGLRGARAVKRAERVAELLDMVSLDPAMARRYPHELSGGQQQRVALARALAGRPTLMLLDESFSALDAGLRVATRTAVSRVLGRAGVTTVLVTHDQAEALSFADQVAVLRSGALSQVGAPSEVYSRPRDAGTASFLGDAVLLDATVAGGVAQCVLGPVPVAGTPAPGPVRLMLRPEQVRFDGAGTPGSGTPGSDTTGFGAPGSVTPARVTGVDFFGPYATVRVTVGDPGTEVTVRHSGAGLPGVGEIVRLRVDGVGVPFSADDRPE